MTTDVVMRTPEWSSFIKETKRAVSLRLAKAQNVPDGFEIDVLDDPFALLEHIPNVLDEKNKGRRRNGFDEIPLEVPEFTFRVARKGNRSWVIGEPNESMAILHRLFSTFVCEACERMPDRIDPGFKKGVLGLPSATAFKEGANALTHVLKHQRGKYFYILDLRHAYESVDQEALKCLLVGIVQFEKPRYEEMIHDYQRGIRYGRDASESLYIAYEDPYMVVMNMFFEMFMTPQSKKGLIVGAPSSPYLFNLFAEIAFDRGYRYTAKAKEYEYSRYADDLVFSSQKPFWPRERREIRRRVERVGFVVNDRKSKVLSIEQGGIPITGFALEQGTGGLVFPQKKRKKLQGMLRTFLRVGEGNHHEIRGHIAHFLEYYKTVLEQNDGVITASDNKMLAMITAFNHECIERRL